MHIQAAGADIKRQLQAMRSGSIRPFGRRGRSAWTGTWILTLVGVALWTLGAGPAAIAAESVSALRDACTSASGPSAIDICRDALRQEPRDSAVRTALSRALVQSGRYDQAIGLLRDGLELEPGNAALKAQLTRVEHLQDEQRWIEERKQKRELSSTTGLTSQQRIEATRMEIRCTRLKGQTALEACNQGLQKFPGNVALYLGKAEALMQLQRYDGALEAYEDALTLDPSNIETRRAFEKASALRQVSVKSPQPVQPSSQTIAAAQPQPVTQPLPATPAPDPSRETLKSLPGAVAAVNPGKSRTADPRPAPVAEASTLPEPSAEKPGRYSNALLPSGFTH